MSLTTNEFIFFDKTDPYYDLVKRIILEQHSITCRGAFDKSYILHCFETFNVGIIYVTNKAQIGKKKRSKTDNYHLKGFVMFVHDTLACFIQGKILCSGYNSKGFGKNLLERVKIFAIDNKVNKWQIFSLAERKLRLYYETFGFSYEDTIYRDGKEKVYQMSIKFDYSNNKVLMNVGKNINISVLDNNISSSNIEYIHGVLYLLNVENVNYTCDDEFSENVLLSSDFEEQIDLIPYDSELQNDIVNLDRRVIVYSKDDVNMYYICFDERLFAFYEGLKEVALILDADLTRISN